MIHGRVGRRFWVFAAMILALGGAAAALGLWAQGVGNVEAGPNQVIFYEHTNWGGNSMDRELDQSIPDLRTWKFNASSTNWNDKISSIKVGKNVKVTVYKHINYKGNHITLLGKGSGGAGDFPNLVNIGWNDKISSLKVQIGNVN